MCGIAGIVNGTQEQVQKMLSVMQSRGPDFCGIGQVDNVVFGHNRLAIIDKTEASNQPIADDERMLTYNGEIYSYVNGWGSDTLWLWNRIEMSYLGDSIEDVLEDCNGMFSFGYYDGEKIILCRDRFGIKPLYYYHEGDKFAFASTPAALATLKPNWNISKKGVQEYLSLGATMLHSMFEGIVAVPPGHYVTFNCKTNEIKTTRWYYPKFIENAREIIKGKVRDSIRRVKLTCDWPQIVLLSGGIDSSLVSSEYSGQTAIHLESPEKEYADQVAKRFNLNLFEAHPHIESAEEGLTDFITKSGEPTMAGLIPWITCKEIAKQGYRVAITANGADELFFGYDRMKGDLVEQAKHIFRPIGKPEFLRIPGMGFDAERHPISINRQWVEIATYLMFDLNKTLDYASMCHSVEVRVPYLDHELVEAALSIPMQEHCAKGNKTILKEMLWELGFSREFTDRPKVGFSLHQTPPDYDLLTAQAMNWYRSTDYEQLPPNSTGRQESYHQNTVIGLYLWHKIFKKL